MAEHDKARQAILMRRRAFVTAALAGAGVTVAGCDDCGPQPCLEPDVHSSKPCLSIARPLPPDAGTVTTDAGAQGDTADAAEAPDAGAQQDASATSATGPDASSALSDKPAAGKPKPPPPKPCLEPARPCLSQPRPRVCLTPKRPDKPSSKL